MAISDEDKNDLKSVINELMDERESKKAEADAKRNADESKKAENSDDGNGGTAKLTFAERILGRSIGAGSK